MPKSPESYKPSFEEEKAAEKMMSDEQREASEIRHDKLLLKELDELKSDHKNNLAYSAVLSMLRDIPSFFSKNERSRLHDEELYDLHLDFENPFFVSEYGNLILNCIGTEGLGGTTKQSIQLKVDKYLLQDAILKNPEKFHSIELFLLKSKIDRNMEIIKNAKKIVKQSMKSEKFLEELGINPDDPQSF